MLKAVFYDDLNNIILYLKYKNFKNINYNFWGKGDEEGFILFIVNNVTFIYIQKMSDGACQFNLDKNAPTHVTDIWETMNFTRYYEDCGFEIFN